MKRKTISELICPWLQVQYPTLGTRQVDLYTKMSRVNVCIWRPKVVCFQPWYAAYLPIAHLLLISFTCSQMKMMQMTVSHMLCWALRNNCKKRVKSLKASARFVYFFWQFTGTEKQASFYGELNKETLMHFMKEKRDFNKSTTMMSALTSHTTV